MQVRDIIKLLEVIDGGKLPTDMHVLSEFIHDTNDTSTPIGDMDFVHFVRSFVKMKTTLNEEVRRDTQEGKIAYLKEDIKQNYVRKDVYEMLFDKCEHLESMLSDLKEKLYGIDKSPHPRYVFSEIPRNMYGDAFVDALKKYLNKKRYSLKVRGQHVKDEYKGTGVTDYGQNIEQSTHLRVYIEEK